MEPLQTALLLNQQRTKGVTRTRDNKENTESCTADGLSLFPGELFTRGMFTKKTLEL